jgi:hypothetical protein
VDWRDPDTWKLPANLIDYWKTILVGGVAIVGAVVTIIGWGLKPFGWGGLGSREPSSRHRSADLSALFKTNNSRFGD